MKKPGPGQSLDVVGDVRLSGPFEANWESLKAGYQAPDWYRDAKFGLWAHWGPQCVPEAGDWYARNMYIQGHPQYEHHLANYGHPADVGFMEIVNQWRAENWNPDDLLSLYKRAGAKYFVAMANHHDNFDNWDFELARLEQSCASVPSATSSASGPRRRASLDCKFGVSNHATRTWHWFQTAYGYDPEGRPRRRALRCLSPQPTRRQGKVVGWPRSAGVLWRGGHAAARRVQNQEGCCHLVRLRHWRSQVDRGPATRQPDVRAQLVSPLQGADRQVRTRPSLLRQFRSAARSSRLGYRRALLQCFGRSPWQP